MLAKIWDWYMKIEQNLILAALPGAQRLEGASRRKVVANGL